MHGVTDPHGLPVIAMTLQSTKKTNVVLQSAPESCKIICESLRMANTFLIQFYVPFKIMSAHMRRASRWAKMGDSREKTPDTPASRSWLVSHVASAGLEPTPDTDLFNTFIYPRSSFSRTVRIDE